MLTISQLADYAARRCARSGTTTPSGCCPNRNGTPGYRSYGAQDIVDLRRIRHPGRRRVPLRRIGEPVSASPPELRDAVAEVDRDLRARIRELQATRRQLARLADEEERSCPTASGSCTRGCASWASPSAPRHGSGGLIPTSALFPGLIEEWLAVQRGLLDHPEYGALMLATDRAFDWEPDDPRVEELAQRTVAFMRLLPLPGHRRLGQRHDRLPVGDHLPAPRVARPGPAHGADGRTTGLIRDPNASKPTGPRLLVNSQVEAHDRRVNGMKPAAWLVNEEA